MHIGDFLKELSKGGRYEHLLPLGFVVIFAIIGLAFVLAERKRREKLREAARGLGFTYSFLPQEDITGRLGNFNLFNIGHSRKAYNVLKGYSNDTYWTVFDYRYTVGHGKHSTTYSQTVAFVDLTEVNLPKFSLGPESFFHRLGEVFGFRDIDFDNNPVFSKKYLLKGPDEELIRRIFKPQLLSFFEQNKNIVSMEAEGGRFIIYHSYKLLKPEELRQFLNEVYGIIRLFIPAP